MMSYSDDSSNFLEKNHHANALNGLSENNQKADAADEVMNIIGQSEAIKKVRFLIGLQGRYDAPVLITGETGTGKELAARGLHYTGTRASQPFIPINCATLSDELFASEVFGHSKGAFTDAKKDKKGLLAIAQKGTLFLDEVDSLSLKSQAALLRFLQEGDYRPVGSEVTYQADVRLIASANCNLEERIARGLFRADLYYRLYILNIHMPALRDRLDDIPVLVDHFIKQFDYQYALGIKRLSADAMRCFKKKSWLGNVRELENLIHRLYLCNLGNTIHLEDALSAPFARHTLAENNDCTDECHDVMSITIDTMRGADGYNFSQDKKKIMEKFEHNYVQHLMSKTQGNVTLAAKLCGKERRAFGKLVKKYNIKKLDVQDHTL
ncbi:MAG: sigma-54 dependent transcriptional regulator [Cellvibrionaceae bacterium]|nr:sigma-54 dependent transcriptional regulator [Cellvibrionaceae bacterium]